MQLQISKPILVYDGDCDFCRYCISRWRHVTHGRIDYAPYQQVAQQFSEIPFSAFQTSVQLILENGEVISGAEAILRALNNRPSLWCYYKLPGVAPLSEVIYRFVAKHRPFFSKATRWLQRTHSD